MTAPVYTTSIALKTAVSDELLVNRDGSTAVQNTADLAVQLASTGAVAASIANTNSKIEAAAQGLVSAATWAQLLATPGTRATQPGRVPSTDTGTHNDPVVGGSVKNSGEYSWSVAPAGWRRTGDVIDMVALRQTASEGVQLQTGIFDRLSMKSGVWPLIEANGDIMLAIDRIGRITGVEFVRPSDRPSVLKGGAIRLIVDDDFNPYLWFDPATGAVRGAGDMFDRSERAGASPLSLTLGRDTAMLVDGHGQILAPGSGDAPVTFTMPVDDGSGAKQQLHIASGSSVRRLTWSPVDCHAPTPIAPGITRYARSDGRISRVRAALGDQLSSTNVLQMILVHGQSLAGGSSSFAPGTLPYRSDKASDNILMFNGGIRAAFGGAAYSNGNFATLTPAVERLDTPVTGLLSDTGMVAMAAGLQGDVGSQYLVAATGVGGAEYPAIKKGTQPWANMIYGVTRGKAIADAAGQTFRVDAMVWRHGESEEDETHDVYRSMIVEAYNDMVTDVVAVTAQAVNPVMILQQINRSQVSVGSGDAAFELEGPGRAVSELVSNPVDGIIVAGPQYICTFGDVFHMHPESYNLMSSYCAKALRRHAWQRQPWKPLHAVSAVRSGRRIDVTFAGGWVDRGGGIAIDTGFVTDPGNYGVVFRDGSASASVRDVVVTGRNTLSLYLSAVPTGASPFLGFAWWSATELDNQGRTTGLRCCIRDNDPEGCPITGLPLHNYAISHVIGVN